MRITKAAHRYAKALLGLALEKNISDKVKADAELIFNTIQNSDELKQMLKSKVIAEDSKLKVLETLFKEHVTEMSLAFLAIITKNQRANLIFEISFNYIQLFKTHNRILPVEVHSAVPLGNDMIENIKRSIIAESWDEIELTEVINPALIGGFVVKGNNKIFDVSVASKLRNLRKELIDDSYISKI
jgi:F-type H+-transporting ATPase subunit delta